MRVAVIGGTGLAGGHVVDALGRAGHDAVVVARSRGVDVASGEGLDDALSGVEAVVDVSKAAAQEAFGAMTERLLAAEERATIVRATQFHEFAGQIVDWTLRDGAFGTDMAGEVLLPGSRARIAPTSFEEWLARSAPTA